MKRIAFTLSLVAATAMAAAPLAAQSSNGPWWDPGRTQTQTQSRGGTVYGGRNNGNVYGNTQADGVWRVNARTPVAEVNRLLRIELPEGADYESLAGLVLDKLKHIPREGESVRFGAVLVKVTKASERMVEEIQIRIGRRRSPVRGPGTIPG